MNKSWCTSSLLSETISIVIQHSDLEDLFILSSINDNQSWFAVDINIKYMKLGSNNNCVFNVS